MSTTEQTAPSTTDSGWVTFAGIMLIIVGLISVLDGFWAFRYDNSVANLVIFEENFTAWGWIWLIVGGVVMAAGFGVFSRQQWARWVGVAVAGVSIISNLSWAEIQPTQSLIGVILATLVIYGLAVHGGELDS